MSGQRTISVPQKRNLMQGTSQGRPAVTATEVAATPISSYRSDNSVFVGSKSANLVPLLESLSGLASGLSDYVNDKRVEQDLAKGAGDQMKGAPLDPMASPAYRAAYSKGKAMADVSSARAKAIQLKAECANMDDKEFTARKQQLFGSFIEANKDDIEYTNAFVRLSHEVEAELDNHYINKQREKIEQDIWGQASTQIQGITQGSERYTKDSQGNRVLSDDFMNKLYDGVEARRQLLVQQGKTNYEAMKGLIMVVGEEAKNIGDENIMDVFKRKYADGSPMFNASLKPMINDYAKEAKASREAQEGHNRVIFNDNQNKWQNKLLNAVEIQARECAAKGDSKGMERLKRVLYTAMVPENNTNGYMLDHSTANAMLDNLKILQKGGKIETNYDKFVEARQAILYDGTIKTYADLQPYRKYFANGDFEQLLGYIDHMNFNAVKAGEKADKEAVEKAAVINTYRTEFDTFLKTRAWFYEKRKIGPILQQYDNVLSTLPASKIPAYTRELKESLAKKDLDEISEGINAQYTSMQAELKKQRAAQKKSVTPAPGKPAGKTIVRYGTYKGKRVAFYSDNSVEYVK